MTKAMTARDVSGNRIEKGDTVATISGSLTAKVCAISAEFDAFFVRLRPLHQPSAKGIWHAADRVLRISTGNRKPGAPATNANANTNTTTTTTTKTPAKARRN